MARAIGKAMPISTKASIEICNSLRGKKVASAKRILKEVIDLKSPIKFTRFTNGAGHKKGIGPGKYPTKAADEILQLIESTEANAQFKGLNTSDLIIKHISAQNAGNTWRYGRHRRRKMKRTNLEIIIEEGKSKKKEPEKKDKKVPEVVKKEENKEVKPNVKKEVATEKKETKAENKPIEKEVEEKPKEKIAQPKKELTEGKK